MSSTTEICNKALYRLGHDEISDIGELNEAARACRLNYDGARRAFLRLHPFAFAIARSELASRGESVAGYAFTYALPQGCLRPLNIVGVPEDQEKEFKTEGQSILANIPNLTLRYVRDVADPTKYDAAFVEAFSIYLAATICVKVTGSSNMMDSLYKLATQKAREAAIVDSNIGRVDEPPQDPEGLSDILKARQ